MLMDDGSNDVLIVPHSTGFFLIAKMSSDARMACRVMACIVMACIVVAYIVMAYMIMACIVVVDMVMAPAQ